jgi:long-subunit fatty acid transport protein
MSPMRGRPDSVLRWLGAVVALLVCPIAVAQTTIEPPMVSPGARSLGLGGAFVAVADDATAAWANPSGLMQLVRPEISVEGRSWSEDREGAASNQSSLGFLSFVLPRREWSIAVYMQTLSSLEFPTEWTNSNGELDPLSGLVIGNFGVSAALRLSDEVSIGFGLAAFAGVFTEGTFDPDETNPFWDGDGQTDAGATAGVLWSLTDAWALGASYRSGADFDFHGGGRATIPDILAGGARWKSAAGSATIAAEVEYLSGIDNRTRLHLGGEWVFLKAKPLIGLRGGVWYDPRGGAVSSTPENGITNAEAVFHAAAGIGFAWRKFQLDLGADYSQRTTIGALSMIFTF